ncbi:hypothetical protein LINPERHAP2_LOCUS26099 [Linum perenne]
MQSCIMDGSSRRPRDKQNKIGNQVPNKEIKSTAKTHKRLFRATHAT